MSGLRMHGISFLVLVAAAIPGFSPGIASAAGRESACVTEFVQFMVWTPAFRRLLWGEKASPVMVDWSQVPAERARSAVEFALGACELELPAPERERLRARYTFRSLDEQLRDGLVNWDANPRSEFFEYLLAVALMESRSGLQQRVAPIVIEAFGFFIRQRAEEAIASLEDAAAREKLRKVLQHRFSEVLYNPGLGASRARVLAGHELEIRAWVHPSELIFILFHELTHASEERADRYSEWSRSKSAQTWVELGIFEEFRARVLTAYFESAWKSRFPQYGIAQQVVALEIWNGLRQSLRPELPEQAKAYEEFFAHWDGLPQKEQELFLDRLLKAEPVQYLPNSR